jgi:hypothetical protein
MSEYPRVTFGDPARAAYFGDVVYAVEVEVPFGASGKIIRPDGGESTYAGVHYAIQEKSGYDDQGRQVSVQVVDCLDKATFEQYYEEADDIGPDAYRRRPAPPSGV